jgi:hypothetical protein
VEVYVVLYSNTKKPDSGDEVKGYYPSEEQADDYCKHKNEICEDGIVYYFEPAGLLQPV